MASQTITVHIKPDDDNKPKIFEPSITSLELVDPGPITWSIYNFCTEPKLWIQFQGFLFVPSNGVSDQKTNLTTSNPFLFGSSMSFGAELNPAVNETPDPQYVTTPPTFPTAAKGSKWQYTIILLTNTGVEDALDPIVVMSGG